MQCNRGGWHQAAQSGLQKAIAVHSGCAANDDKLWFPRLNDSIAHVVTRQHIVWKSNGNPVRTVSIQCKADLVNETATCWDRRKCDSRVDDPVDKHGGNQILRVAL